MMKYKIIVLGNSGVGKTSLTFRFCDGQFDETVMATIGVDYRSKIVEVDGERIELQIWDTAGQERHHTLASHYFRGVHAIIFVYDVTDKASFNSLPSWIEECELHCNLSATPRILIGNKCDEGAQVPRQNAQLFAARHDMALFETSAKLDSEFGIIEGIFMTIAHKLKNDKPLIIPRGLALTDTPHNDEPPKKSCC